MKDFYQVLINTLVANVTTSFLWFSLTFWVYLETKSVFATALISGTYMLFLSLAGIPFGTFVDHQRKKIVMLVGTLFALAAFVVGGIIYASVPKESLLDLTQPWFWIFGIILLAGSVVESMRSIALSTTVTILVPKDRRDKANGLVGTVNGLSFMATSVFSGLAIGFLGMGWVIVIAIALMTLTAIHMAYVHLPEPKIVHDPNQSKVDIKGSIAAITAVSGLAGLIAFTTLNNLMNGVSMAITDPYGLSLVSVESWGFIWGFLSTGFIIGGIFVASRGLGQKPVRTLLLVNVALWAITILFPIKSTIIFFIIGLFICMCLFPIIEAVEQTVIQRVVPLERQGRVFGFAQSIEAAAAPLMAFIIGPLTQFVFIPSMQPDGALANSIGSWFGTGEVRAMALVFIVSGIAGLALTLAAFTTKSYRRLSNYYAKA